MSILKVERKITVLYLIILYALVLYFITFYGAADDGKIAQENLRYSFFSFITLTLITVGAVTSGIKLNSIFMLFLVAFSVFIFGRYIFVVLNFVFFNINKSDKLFNLTWMNNFVPNAEQGRSLFFISNIFILTLFAGYFLKFKRYSSQERVRQPEHINQLKIISKFFVWVLLPFHTYSIFGAYIATLDGGYLALYSSQGDSGGQKSSLLSTLLYISLFTLIALREKKYVYITIAIFILTALTGTRGLLVTGFLSLLYVLDRNGIAKVSNLKLILSLLPVYFLMKFVTGFSTRFNDVVDETSTHFVFLYEQGITLSVIGYSIFSNLQYELHTLMQSFVPGFFRIYKLFDPEIPFYHASVTSFISYSANPKMFLSGAGLGSSIISELFILSMSSIIVFSIFSFFIGCFLAYLESWSYKNYKVFIFTCSMLPIFLFSPRNGFNVLFITGIYSFIIIYLMSLSAKYMNFNRRLL